MNIVFLDEATVGKIGALDLIKREGIYTSYNYTPKGLRLARVEDAEVVITNKVVISRDIMEQTPTLKLICVAATGMNNVDLEAARELGIEVRNVAGYSTDSVVQITFSLLFELMSHTSHFNNYIHDGEYCTSPSFTSIAPAFRELSGKSYGIIGLGQIGRRVAEVATAFGAEVSYYSTSGKNSNDDYTQLSLDELLRGSDVISIHSPLNDATRGLINKASFDMMKKDALIINVGRGGIIVERDLADALNRGAIAGAALDVFTAEPMVCDNPLLEVKDRSRLVMTPHIAWASVEARERLVYGIAENIKNYKKNK